MKNSTLIRAFIAVDISDETRDAIARLIEELRPAGRGVKWANPAGIHVTLKFLGNVEIATIPSVAEAMERAADGVEPFRVVVSGAGAFPGLKKPRVYWAGVEDESGGMAALAAKLDAELERAGFEPERRVFRPHLTIGRVRKGAKTDDISDIIRRHEKSRFGQFDATAFSLYRSELKPAGAVYTALETVKLAGAKRRG